MVIRCEICNKRISKAVFNSQTTAAGKSKNKGECDNCADEFREKMTNLFSSVVATSDDAVYIGKDKFPISEGENKRE